MKDENPNTLTESDVWAMLGARDVQLYRLERENARLREELAKLQAGQISKLSKVE